MGKCICLSRVSTGLQDLDQQTEKLLEAAHSYGYSDNNIITIEDKESAVCRSEEERNGLTNLKEYIADGGIDMVVVYELSRIARRADVLYSIRDFLISHKVQLVVMNPSFKLLKEDGTIDENSNILMGIFCSLSENEGYLRKARFKRGKAKKAAEGKLISGMALYGYRIENQEAVICEEEAEVIRGIYNDYIFNNKTAKDITLELIKSGVKEFASLNAGVQFVYHILHNCSYAGISSEERRFNTSKVYHYCYPAIVSKELFEKSMEMANTRKKYNKTKSKYNYLCRGILYNKNMKPFSVFTSHKSYSCSEYTMEGTKSIEIKVEMFDSFVWDVVSNRILYRPQDFSTNMEKKIKEEIASVEVSISNIESAISEREEKIKRIEYRLIQGKLNEDDADEFEAGIKKEIEELDSNLDSLRERRERLSAKMINLSDSSLEVTREALNELSFEEKEKIVRKELISIIMVKNDCHNVTFGMSFNDCDDTQVYCANKMTKKIEKLGF